MVGAQHEGCHGEVQPLEVCPQGHAGGLRGHRGPDGCFLRPTSGRRVPRAGAGHGCRLVPQTTEPRPHGTAADLGVRHHLPARPDQLPLRSVDTAIHEDVRRLRRVRRRPEYSQRQSAGYLERARHAPVRSDLDTAQHDRQEPAGLDGRGRRLLGRSAPCAARDPGDRLRKGDDPLHSRRSGMRFGQDAGPAHSDHGRQVPTAAFLTGGIRIGRKGRLTHVWYRRGARPRGVRQQGFSSAYLFGAVCPERGEGVALVLPEVSTAAMDVFLAELSRAVPAGTHAALVLDGAGWHVSEDLTVPANLTLIHPPPYSPELNPVERVWEYLRDRWLSHRVLAGGHEAVVDAACAAWNA